MARGTHCNDYLYEEMSFVHAKTPYPRFLSMSFEKETTLKCGYVPPHWRANVLFDHDDAVF